MEGERLDRLIVAGLLLTVTLVIAQATSQVIDFGLYDQRIAALDSNLHSSIFGVASLLAQAAAALAAVGRAQRQPHRVAWLWLAGLVGSLLLVRIVFAYDAGLLIVPTAVVFVLYWWLSAHETVRARRLLRGALCLLVFSFVVHAVGPKVVTALGYDATGWAWQVKGILKHTTELAGWALLAIGTAVAAAPVVARGSRRA